MMQNLINKEQYTPRERDNIFYHLLAGGAKIRLLESVIHFKLPELLADCGPLTAEEVASRLNLNHHRAKKWLNLLKVAGLLESESKISSNGFVESYSPSSLSKTLFGEDGRSNWIFRDMVYFWENVSYLNLVEVLRGMHLSNPVHWPPKSQEAAEHLSQWMRVSSEQPIQAIKKAIDLKKVNKILDVGGNDATMACSFASFYPNLKITVFDLKEANVLARKNIEKTNLSGCVKLVAGNFLTDDLPHGFDLVIFSRTLTDWSPEVCRLLLEKARKSLVLGGRLLICEAFLEGNEDMAISWEYRYVFYDDFGVGVFKHSDAYNQMLDELGYGKKTLFGPDEQSFYSVLIADRE